MSGSDETLFDSILDTYHVKLSVGEYLRPVPFRKSDWKKLYSIILPLPPELKDSTHVAYSETTQGMAANLLNGDIVSGVMAHVLKNIGDGVVVGYRDATVAEKGQRTAFESFFPPKDITSILQQQFGHAPNPNPSVMFEGPALRRFTMSWLLQPRTPEESYKIQRVVKKLKTSALPKNAILDSSAILKYPHLCQVNFFPWDSEYAGNEWGWGDKSPIKMKKCFMTDVEADYTPGNLPAFFEGTKAPAVVRLTIQLQEVEYMMANDWDESAKVTTTSPEIFAKAVGKSIEGASNTLSRSYDDAVDQVTQFGLNVFGGRSEEQGAVP